MLTTLLLALHFIAQKHNHSHHYPFTGKDCITVSNNYSSLLGRLRGLLPGFEVNVGQWEGSNIQLRIFGREGDVWEVAGLIAQDPGDCVVFRLRELLPGIYVDADVWQGDPDDPNDEGHARIKFFGHRDDIWALVDLIAETVEEKRQPHPPAPF
jgi:hypothetical protein